MVFSLKYLAKYQTKTATIKLLDCTKNPGVFFAMLERTKDHPNVVLMMRRTPNTEKGFQTFTAAIPALEEDDVLIATGGNKLVAFKTGALSSQVLFDKFLKTMVSSTHCVICQEHLTVCANDPANIEIMGCDECFGQTCKTCWLDWEQACLKRWDDRSPHPTPCPASCPSCRHVSASDKQRFRKVLDDDMFAKLGIPLSYISQYR